jgi:hypothetical protein
MTVVRSRTPGFAEGIIGQVHDLLRRAATLNRRIGLGEDRVTPLKVADELPGFVHILVGVVTADPFFPDRLFEALHLVPVKLDPGRDHEIIILYFFPILGEDGVVLRGKFRHGILYPGDSPRNERAFVTFGDRFGKDATADQCPQRLVIMFNGGLDNGDVRMWESFGQSCRHGNARAAAADDNDAMMDCQSKIDRDWRLDLCLHDEPPSDLCVKFVFNAAKSVRVLFSSFRHISTDKRTSYSKLLVEHH